MGVQWINMYRYVLGVLLNPVEGESVIALHRRQQRAPLNQIWWERRQRQWLRRALLVPSDPVASPSASPPLHVSSSILRAAVVGTLPILWFGLVFKIFDFMMWSTPWIFDHVIYEWLIVWWLMCSCPFWLIFGYFNALAWLKLSQARFFFHIIYLKGVRS